MKKTNFLNTPPKKPKTYKPKKTYKKKYIIEVGVPSSALCKTGNACNVLSSDKIWSVDDVLRRIFLLVCADSKTLLELSIINKRFRQFACMNVGMSSMMLSFMKMSFKVVFDVNELIFQQISESNLKLKFAEEYTNIVLRIDAEDQLNQLAQLISDNTDQLRLNRLLNIKELDVSCIAVMNDEDVKNLNEVLAFFDKNKTTSQLSTLKLGSLWRTVILGCLPNLKELKIKSIRGSNNELVLSGLSNLEKLEIELLFNSTLNLPVFLNLQILKIIEIKRPNTMLKVPTLPTLKLLELCSILDDASVTISEFNEPHLVLGSICDKTRLKKEDGTNYYSGYKADKQK